MRRLVILFALGSLATAAFATVLVLQPGSEGKDSMVYLRRPTENYGTDTFLMRDYGPGATVRGLVEFTGLSAIPAGSTVNSAKLELWMSYNNRPNDNFGIYRITASWSEATVNWSNQPAHNSTAYVKRVITRGGWHEWDVKTLVQEWVNRTHSNYGFKLIRDNESGRDWPYPVSSDWSTASNRPKLTVDYTLSAVAPASVGKVKALCY